LRPPSKAVTHAIKAPGKQITTDGLATGTSIPGDISAIEAFYNSHTGAKGLYSVSGGSTESLAKVMQKLGLVGKVHAAGFDLTEQTIKLLKEGFIDFTIDQQPYLQGFVPTLQMFLYKVSNTQTGLFEARSEERRV